MKLVFFIYSLSSGGAERVTANLANYWAERGWEITIITIIGKEHDFFGLLPNIRRVSLNIAIDNGNIGAGFWYNYLRIKKLRKLLKQERPRVVLGMMSTANILLGFAAKGMKLVAIGSERTYPPMYPLGNIWEKLRKYGYGLLDALVAQTDQTALWIRDNTYVRRIHVIPNPVLYPMPVYRPVMKPDNLEFKYRLLATGRLSEEKRFDMLLRVFSKLVPKYPQWQLIILGEGPCRKELESLREKLGVQKQVLLPGAVGNVGDWYEAADLYVLTSRFEGFPNTLAEALAHGLPAVSVDCDTGPRDIIRHGIDGLLVPQNDSPALANALSKLMEDEDMRRRYAARAVEARERFSIERIAQKWERLFEDVMK